ncbi:MAG: hypothetical protein WCI94_07890 [Rhodospirillales bacterium]
MSTRLIDTVTDLANTLARENAALDALDLSGAIALLPEKRRALTVLTETEAIVLRPDLRPAMEVALRRLRDLSAENRRLLKHALTVQSRVTEIVASALPRTEAAGRYAAPGARIPAARPAAWSLIARA